MFLIDDVLVNDEVYQKNFICNIEKCKGACCWEGEYGAPLEESEIDILEKDLNKILPYISEAGKAVIAEKGFYTLYKELKKNGTELLPGGMCVFLKMKDGVGKCGIEDAYEHGETEFIKPISCHLYPIRVDYNPENGFDVLKYDKWDICSEACKLGDDHKVKIYQFLKEALIRKYGSEFYNQLDLMVDKFNK